MQFARNAASFFLLRQKHAFQEEPAYRFGLFDFFNLLAFLLAQVGYHHAQAEARVSSKSANGQINRDQIPVAGTQVEFAFRNCFLGPSEESLKSFSLCLLDERLDRRPDKFLCWPANQFCKPAVTVEQSAIS